MVEETEVPSLRKIVQRNGDCVHRFDQAKRLADSLFTRKDCVPLPFFTPHDASHCHAIENYIDQIIWGTGAEGTDYFYPTSEEAMYLLSAIWLHDIGMFYGIMEGEDDPVCLNDPAVVMKLRQNHEMRTLEYIHNRWKFECDWEKPERRHLSDICVYHRRHRLIGGFAPAVVLGTFDKRSVRLACLAALLRLADACHEDQSRAPYHLMALYASLGMTQDVAAHWEKAKLIERVTFDHTNRIIVVEAACPQSIPFDIGSFDLSHIVGHVCQDIQIELQSVQPVLLRHPNLYFNRVENRIYHSPCTEIGSDKQYLDTWPYLLNTPTCSTEAAAALARLMLLAVKEGTRRSDSGTAWRDKMLLPIMRKAHESRPLDFMIRNLCKRATNILDEFPDNASVAPKLIACLESYLIQINRNCNSIAEKADESNIVEPQDVLLLHGYSTNIDRFLTRIGTKFKGSNSLYVFYYHEPPDKVRLGSDENVRIKQLATELKFRRVVFLELASAAQVLDELKHNKISCRFLLGTHGVLKSKDLLCKVGSHVLASEANRSGAKVIAFAETTKFLTNGESDEDVANIGKLFPSQRLVQHPIMTDTMWLTPLMDTVPKKFVDFVVTEEGVFPPSELPVPKGEFDKDIKIEKTEKREE